MLDLNSETAVDYSSNIDYFPFDTFGDFEFIVLAYEESGDCGTEKNKSDKEFDTVTVEVLKSSLDIVRAGEKFVFWFQTGGDGVNQKNRSYKAAELRQCVTAISGVSPTSKDYKLFDAAKARKDLLAKDFSDGNTGVALRTTKGKERSEPGTFFTEKAWKPLSA